MGQIGRFTYPEIGPREAAEVLQVIRGEIGETIQQEDRERLADLLGHESADSGAFKQKLSALKKYGLLKGRGSLQTTPLANRLIHNTGDAFEEMLNNVDILNHAYKHFKGEKVQRSEWENFLEETVGLQEGVDEISGSEKLYEIYLEFVGLIQTDAEEYLDKKREFNYYIEKLDNPNTRDPAIQALNTNLRERRLPDEEPLQVILDFVREEEYPDHLSEFYELLRIICENNRLDRKHREEIEDLLYEKLDIYTSEEYIGKRKNSQKTILNIQEELKPKNIVDEWWDLLLQKLVEGNEIPNNDMRDFVRHELSNRLMVKDTEIRREFYDTKADEAEDKLWDLMAEAEGSHNLKEDCEFLLQRLGVL
jgi:hypothetical protein